MRDGFPPAAGDTVSYRPTLTEGPVPQQAQLSQRVSFTCIASGSPQPLIRWYKDGTPLQERAGHVLLFEEVALSDRGFYHCTATNARGAVTSDPVLLRLPDVMQYVVPLGHLLPGTEKLRSGFGLHFDLAELVKDLNGLGQTGLVFEGEAESVFIYFIELFGNCSSISTGWVSLWFVCYTFPLV